MPVGFFGVRSSVLLCIHLSGHPTVPMKLLNAALARGRDFLGDLHTAFCLCPLAPTHGALREKTVTASHAWIGKFTEV